MTLYGLQTSIEVTKTSIMKHLVILLIAVLHHAQCHDITKRSVFSWGSSKEQEPPTGYLPILKVHKYNGVQISPVQGSPVYLPNGPSEINFEQNPQITPDQIQQLDLINRLAYFLPEENLQEVDLSSVLPYVNLISEDSLDNIRSAVEAGKTKDKSKLLKLIAFIKYIKEKKLKPFKYAASLGSKIVHKKKEKVSWLFGATTPTTTQEPYTETPASVTYPPYVANPNYFQNKQFYNSLPTLAPELSQASYQQFSFPQYQPSFQFNSQKFSEPQYQQNSEPYQPKLPASIPAPAPSSYPQSDPVPAQYPQSNSAPAQYSQSNLVSAQYPQSNPALAQYPQPNSAPARYSQPNLAPAQYPQPNPAPAQYQLSNRYNELKTPSNQYQPQYKFQSQSELPTFPINQYQPQYASLPSFESSKNEISFEYKQSPASTFASQDNNLIRQFASSSNSSESRYAPTSAPKNEVSTEQYYSQASNYIFPFNLPQQPVLHPKIQSYPTFAKSSEPNKFYLGQNSNDLAASGSENIEKINEQKPEIRSEEKESKTDLPTSTEISYSKSTGKRTILRQATPKSPVYEAPKNETGDDKSSPANNVSVN